MQQKDQASEGFRASGRSGVKSLNADHIDSWVGDNRNRIRQTRQEFDAPSGYDNVEILQEATEVFQRVRKGIDESRLGLSMFSAREALLFAHRNLLDLYKKALQNYKGNDRAVGIRYLISLERNDVEIIPVLRSFLEMGIQIRHCQGVLPISFIVIDSSSLWFTLDRSESTNAPSQVMICREHDVVKRYEMLFENLWIHSADVERRIKDIEEGRPDDEGQIEVIQDPKEIQNKLVSLVGASSREVLLMLPTVRSIHNCQKVGVIDAIQESTTSRCVRAKILAPSDPYLQSAVRMIEEEATHSPRGSRKSEGSTLLDFREISRSSTGAQLIILVIDGEASLIIELKDDLSEDFEGAVGSAIYSKSRPTVNSYVTFFENLWHEGELRSAEQRAKNELQISLEKEEKMRRRAELLQDIMTHDIRNYNQIGLLSAEILYEELRDRPALRLMVDSLLASMHDSVDLLERARRLGLVLSEHEVELGAVQIRGQLDKAISVVRRARPDKEINETRKVLLGENQQEVLADNFLTEVFVNLYSNSAKFTNGKQVCIDTIVEHEICDNVPFVKITISDRGSGVPDELKRKIFTRYLGGEKGIGLGMSIIYALVVERFHGRILLKDRINGDFSQGVSVEVWLRAKTN